MRLNSRGLLAAALAAVFSLPAFASAPLVGQRAPALTFTDLLNAPAGAKADWKSLHGKVVVLEFWATWCAPCIAQIPHLNAMAQSLASNPVQFIGVDDEDPAVVKEFLAKKKMAGWVGLDTSKKIFDAYGVKSRPTTVVIDAQGKIAAVLSPERLNQEDLAALSEGKLVKFPVEEAGIPRDQIVKEAEAAAAVPSGDPAAPKPLFEISIRPGDPKGQVTMLMRPARDGVPALYEMRNVPIAEMVQWARSVPASRVVIHGASDARYTLRLTAPDLDTEPLAPALEIAIATATGMKVSHVSTEEDVWLLKATPQANALLSPTASKFESMCFYNPGDHKLMMVKTTLDSLAPSLDDAVGAPVVNETGVAGEFDASFEIPNGDVPSITAALEKNMGLTLVKARRSVERIVLDPLPAAKPDTTEKESVPAAIPIAIPVPKP